MAVPSPVPFDVSCEDEGEGTRLHLYGELDMASAPLLMREVETVARRGAVDIVLDLSALSFVDVSGLRAILDAARAARRDGRSLVVANPMPHIVRLLELTAIDQSLVVRGRPLSSVS